MDQLSSSMTDCQHYLGLEPPNQLFIATLTMDKKNILLCSVNNLFIGFVRLRVLGHKKSHYKIKKLNIVIILLQSKQIIFTPGYLLVYVVCGLFSFCLSSDVSSERWPLSDCVCVCVSKAGPRLFSSCCPDDAPCLVIVVLATPVLCHRCLVDVLRMSVR